MQGTISPAQSRLKIEEWHPGRMSPHQTEELRELCSLAADERLAPNWLPDDWESKTSSLFYLLHREGRFSEGRGRFFLLYDQDRLVACSGVYLSAWSNQVAVGGVRTFTHPRYRMAFARETGKFYHSDILLPWQFEWARRQGCVAFALSFTEESKTLLEFLRRIGRGEAVALGLKPSPETAKFYSHFVLHPEKVLVQFVEQDLYYRVIQPSQFQPETHIP